MKVTQLVGTVMFVLLFAALILCMLFIYHQPVRDAASSMIVTIAGETESETGVTEVSSDTDSADPEEYQDSSQGAGVLLESGQSTEGMTATAWTDVYIRTSPEAADNISGVLYEGESVTCVANVDSNGWQEVAYQQENGHFVYSDYLRYEQ